MDSPSFTLFHVAISLLGIASGLGVLYGLLRNDPLRSATALFLATTVLTSLTGYFFHRDHILPSHIVGAISLALLAIAIAGYYPFGLRGFWRPAYVVTAVAALYLNVFVLVAQLFLKVPALHALAPKGSEPLFALAQGAVLLVFVVLGFLAVRRFHPAAAWRSRP